MRRSRQTYLRFELKCLDNGPKPKRGVLPAARMICDCARITAPDRNRLFDLLDWMDQPRFQHRRRTGATGIAWYKSSASRHIANMREIGRILSTYGHFPTEIKSRHPGTIIYEDEFQIVAEPVRATGQDNPI